MTARGEPPRMTGRWRRCSVGLADRQDKYRQALLGLERRQAYIAAEVMAPGRPRRVAGEHPSRRNTGGMTGEQVLALRRDMPAPRQCVLTPLDDHSSWGLDSEGDVAGGARSEELLGQLPEIVECWAREDGWGTEAL